MRFIVMVKATPNSEAGVMPGPEMFEAMGKFNEELVKAGIMKAGEGLKPSSNGVRVHFSGAKRTVVDGPFAETKEILGGFVLIEAADRDEAVAIAATNPFARLGSVEVRPVVDFSKPRPVL